MLELSAAEDFSGLHEIQIVPHTAANQDLVVERETLMSEAQIFSFADASEELPALAETVEDLPVKDQHISNPSWSEEDEIPFSLGDLMSSFEAKSADNGGPNLDNTPLEAVPSSDLGAPNDSVYHAEDPALWPSIAKVEAEQEEASEDTADNATNFSTF